MSLLSMSRREVLAMLASLGVSAGTAALLTACAPGAPAAAATRRIPHIGYLAAGVPPSAPVGAFIQGLRDLGYIEGQNIVLDIRYPFQAPERLDEMVAELVRLKVDVLAVDSGTWGLAAKRATSTVPIVLLSSGDPTVQGLADSLAHPGGNVTGLSLNLGQTDVKHVELLGELLPDLAQLGVVVSPGLGMLVDGWRQQAPNIRVQRIEIARAEDIENAFQTAANAKLQALLFPITPLTGAASGQIAGLTAKYRLPTAGNLPNRATILAYGANNSDLRRRGAGYVDRILKGAKPADLPIEEPTTFNLVVNVKLAQTIGLTIPPSVLAQATEVIQ